MAKRHSDEFGDLLYIPGVGKSLAGDLRLLGIIDIASLRGADPEGMFMRLCSLLGRQDRCVLYVFRCAVYFAETAQPEPEKLKWWNWKD